MHIIESDEMRGDCGALLHNRPSFFTWAGETPANNTIALVKIPLGLLFGKDSGYSYFDQLSTTQQLQVGFHDPNSHIDLWQKSSNHKNEEYAFAIW